MLETLKQGRNYKTFLLLLCHSSHEDVELESLRKLISRLAASGSIGCESPRSTPKQCELQQILAVNLRFEHLAEEVRPRSDDLTRAHPQPGQTECYETLILDHLLH